MWDKAKRALGGAKDLSNERAQPVGDSHRTSVKLGVADARQRDVGHGKVRIDNETMQKLTITAGDFVEIHGKKMTVAVAWPAYAEDQGEEIVRMDGLIRRNAGVALGEFVILKKTDVKGAEAMIFAPTDVRLSIDEEFVSFVKRRFMDMPFVEGDMTLLSIFGSAVPLVVTRTRPHGPVKILETSHVQVLTEPTPVKRILSTLTYEDIGGLDAEIRALRETVETSLRHPEVFQRLGVEPPKAVLLHGPHGCGKTLLAKALANESDVGRFLIFQPGGTAEEMGAKLREAFQQAQLGAPSLILIGDVDKIPPNHLLPLMEGASSNKGIAVVGTTEQLSAVDNSLRRPGIFDKEIMIPLPDSEGRAEILGIHTKNTPFADDVDLRNIANLTEGYTGAQLTSLCKDAATQASRRYSHEINLEEERIPPEVLDKMTVSMADFEAAIASRSNEKGRTTESEPGPERMARSNAVTAASLGHEPAPATGTTIRCKRCNHENSSEHCYCSNCGCPLRDETKIY
jgi:transitional endoplasmic reticulum ATPase